MPLLDIIVFREQKIDKCCRMSFKIRPITQQIPANTYYNRVEADYASTKNYRISTFFFAQVVNFSDTSTNTGSTSRIVDVTIPTSPQFLYDENESYPLNTSLSFYRIVQVQNESQDDFNYINNLGNSARLATLLQKEYFERIR